MADVGSSEVSSECLGVFRISGDNSINQAFSFNAISTYDNYLRCYIELGFYTNT